jgi:hypothetical protein
MEYYQAIGDPKGTLLMRYFVTEDEEVRAKALPEVQHAMENLVIQSSAWPDRAPVLSADNHSRSSLCFLNLEQPGTMARAQIGRVNWQV